MTSRFLALLGLILVDLGVFAATVVFLPRAGTFGYSGPWSYFLNSRDRWDIAWGVLAASALLSAGLFLLLDALGAFKDDQGESEP